jgi:hypothetical protein
MKFGEKYELLESLTTGAVETFVANDKIRGERVVVHILNCPARQANQPSAEWIRASFRQVAPEPAGPVLETGRFSDQYAYLVTKPPDDAALQSWVRRYEVQGKDAHETADTSPEFHEAHDPTVVMPQITHQMSATVTQVLRNIDSSAKLQSSAAMPGEQSKGKATTWEVPNQTVLPTDTEDLTAGPGESQSASFAPPGPAETKAPAIQNTQPHEFTSFFQGPFHGDRRAEIPDFSSQASEPPRKAVGEFTAMFGKGAPAELELPPSDPGTSAQPSFTEVFKDMDRSLLTFHSSTALPPESIMSASVDPLPTPTRQSEIPPPVPSYEPPKPQPATLPPPIVFAKPVPESPRAVAPAVSPGDGATSAFSRPTAESAVVEPEEPAGPSPYTQIINKADLQAIAENDAAGAGEDSEKAAAPPKISAPKISGPKIPVAPPAPSKPKAPAMPKPFTPKADMPKVAVPAAPKAPKVEAPAEPPVSYWPLVLTLTVLFFLAVLLVLYFVLKK